MPADKQKKIAIIIAAAVAVILIITVIAILVTNNNKNKNEPVVAPVVTGTPAQNPTADTTEEPTVAPTEAATEVPTTAPTPAKTPTPAAAPVTSLSGLSTTSIGWWYGRYKGTDANGVEQYDYILPDIASTVHKYNGITGHGEGKVAYLTFDEGYENGFTPAILDTLKEKNVKAVFFVTGDFVDSEPELVRRMYQEGHIIGNHTDNHPRMPEQTDEQFKKELLGVEEKVNKVLGFKYDMRYYRPPEGKFSERDLALASNMGYKAVFWSFAYVDWDHPKEPSQELTTKSYQRIIQSMHGQEVLLLHAVSSANSAVLGDVIDYYHSQGYTFGTMNDL